MPALSGHDLSLVPGLIFKLFRSNLVFLTNQALSIFVQLKG